MAKQQYRCSICGYQFFAGSLPSNCPVCAAAREKFILVEENGEIALQLTKEKIEQPAKEEKVSLDHYLSDWSREGYEQEEKFSIIQKISKTGKSEISPMGTRKQFPGFDTILFKGSQFNRFPLNEEEPVSTWPTTCC